MSDVFINVSVEQFKEYFFRDFPFLPVYKPAYMYKKNKVVYDKTSDLFYKSLTFSRLA